MLPLTVNCTKDGGRGGDMMRWAIVLFLGFTIIGCSGAPITATSPEGRVSTTYSMDMEFDKKDCSVRTYRDQGVDADGEPYLRMGRVFYNDRMKILTYLPNFSWMSGALAFASIGSINAMGGGARTAVLIERGGLWIGSERIAPGEFRVLTVDPILEEAIAKTAVILQLSGKEKGLQYSIINNCERINWK